MSIAMPAIAPRFIHGTVKRRKNTWYSIKDGNWNDKSVWISNERRRWDWPGQGDRLGTFLTNNQKVAIFPEVGDDVYINHTVACNISTRVNNLYISGSLTSATAGVEVFVYGDVQCTGSAIFSSTINLIMCGVNNYIVSFTAGTSTISYARVGLADQNIMDLSYYSLAISGDLGVKYAIANLSLAGNLNIAGNLLQNFGDRRERTGILEMGAYNLTVNGTTGMGNQGDAGTLRKSGAGTVLFIGLVTAQSSRIDFSGNPTVEVRGGLNFNLTAGFVSGTGKWSLTTNNQTETFTNLRYQFNGDVEVVGAITVTNAYVGVVPAIIVTHAIQINSSLNGTVAGSAWINKGNLLMNNILFPNPMTIGSIDKDTFPTNLIGYIFNGNYTLQYLTYANLLIEGSGTKTAAGNTVLAAKLLIGGTTNNTIFNMAAFNLSVGTICQIGQVVGFAQTLQKTGAGSVLFIGNVSISNSNPLPIDFSGNPAVELRGGITGTNPSHPAQTAINSGTGVWSFTTNNQTIQMNGNSNISGWSIDAPFLISGAITLTNLGGFTGYPYLRLLAGINGNNAASTFDNRGQVQYRSATAPMVTGILVANAAPNIFVYDRAGAQDIKGGTYTTLEFAGSGTKTLLGNVTCTNFTLNDTATINFNGFTIAAVNHIHVVAGTLFTNASFSAVNLIIRAAVTLPSNKTFTDVTMDTGNQTITFGGFTLTSTGTTYYTNAAQRVWGTANLIVNNMTLGGTGNKTLQGNIVIPGTYTVLGTAVLVLNGFTKTP